MIELDPASVEAVAVRVVELLEETAPADARLLPASEVARRFGLSRAYVYRHADELGAIKVGTGQRPRLRFEAERVAQALTPCSPSGRSESGKAAPQAKSKPRRRSGVRAAPDLLPIRGRSVKP
jgi:hypothetical protein